MKPNVSLFFPAYNDEHTLPNIVDRSISLLNEIANEYEIIIVNDCSPDNSGKVADVIAASNSKVKVIHHAVNMGYGGALKTGVANSKYEWICMVDGDNEYDVYELKKMLAVRDYYQLIIGFRYKKLYSTKRIFISYIYNQCLRLLFKSPFRDVSTGIRVMHHSIINQINITSNSPFVGAELALKAMLRGIPVGEVGIQTFPRIFGSGSATSLKNIRLTISDVFRVRKEIFSDSYDLPSGRVRHINEEIYKKL